MVERAVSRLLERGCSNLARRLRSRPSAANDFGTIRFRARFQNNGPADPKSATKLETSGLDWPATFHSSCSWHNDPLFQVAILPGKCRRLNTRGHHSRDIRIRKIQKAIIFPAPDGSAENVVVMGPSGVPDPLVTVQKITIQARYVDLFLRPGFVARMVLKGLQVHIPLRGSGHDGKKQFLIHAQQNARRRNRRRWRRSRNCPP